MKRFSDTLKWSDPWFRRLSAPAKALWYYMTEHCDMVGIVDLDFGLVSEDWGLKIGEQHMTELGRRVQRMTETKWLIRKFIPFQYGTLSPSCPPHRKVISMVESLGLTLDGDGYAAPAQSPAPAQTDLFSEPEKPSKSAAKSNKDRPTDKSEFDAYFREQGLFPMDAEYGWERWNANGWENGGKKIKDWRGVVRSWKAARYWPSQKQGIQTPPKAWDAEKPEAPAWLPTDWHRIAALYDGPKAHGYKVWTEISAGNRHDFQRACRGEIDLPEQD